LEKFPNLIIVGDFNFPNIASNTEQIFVDFVSENSFSQLINEPTRYRTCQNPSLSVAARQDQNLVGTSNFFGQSLGQFFRVIFFCTSSTVVVVDGYNAYYYKGET
jgi:hypothetical protein